MAALQLRPKLRTLHNPSLVNLFSTFPTPPDPTPADQSPSSTSPHPAQSQSQSQSQSPLSSDDLRETIRASIRPLLERERKGAEGETLSQSALSSAPSRSVTAKADENSANAKSGSGKDRAKLMYESIRETMRRLRFGPSSSPGTAQNEGRSAHPMSLSEYQNSFKLKPSTESGPVIGGTGMLPASVFGKERERKGAEGETMATKTEFVKKYSTEELYKKLSELPPEGRFISNEMLEMEEKETESNIGGVHMRDLRESLMTLKMSNDENAMKSSRNWGFGYKVWNSLELELNVKNNGKLLWLVGDEKF
ncbi:hypothetical protein FH972_001908 [Carpinus fangiana]|uniref:Uncharacterized protein n=1 Tax=Carpinus fangiana TaxID=176857 RepID=A0A5N6QGI6_9ROSI|nr:hypothetical protein FH972_001908 [Carpinus fangiana]